MVHWPIHWPNRPSSRPFVLRRCPLHADERAHTLEADLTPLAAACRRHRRQSSEHTHPERRARQYLKLKIMLCVDHYHAQLTYESLGFDFYRFFGGEGTSPAPADLFECPS